MCPPVFQGFLMALRAHTRARPYKKLEKKFFMNNSGKYTSIAHFFRLGLTQGYFLYYIQADAGLLLLCIGFNGSICTMANLTLKDIIEPREKNGKFRPV